MLSDLFVYVRPSPSSHFLYDRPLLFPPTVISACCSREEDEERDVDFPFFLPPPPPSFTQTVDGGNGGGRKRKRRDELEEAHTYSPFPFLTKRCRLFSKINSIISRKNVYHRPKVGASFSFPITHPEKKTKTPPSPPSPSFSPPASLLFSFNQRHLLLLLLLLQQPQSIYIDRVRPESDRPPPYISLSLLQSQYLRMRRWGEERDGGRTRSGALYEVGTLAAEAADYKYVSGISFGAQTSCTFYNNINANKPNPIYVDKKGKTACS